MTLARYSRALFAAPLLALSLAGCVEMAAVGVGTAVLSANDRRTTGTQIEDERLELVASNRFSEKFGDRAHIDVTAFNRNVLLTGEVPDEKAKAEAEKIAAGLPNVRGVTNDLQIGGVSSLTSRASDAGITGKVKARFLDGQRFSPVHVKVVTEAEAAAAVEIARTTGGVRKVVKVFDYCKTSEAVCAPPAKPKAEEAKKKSGS